MKILRILFVLFVAISLFSCIAFAMSEDENIVKKHKEWIEKRVDLKSKTYVNKILNATANISSGDDPLISLGGPFDTTPVYGQLVDVGPAIPAGLGVSGKDSIDNVVSWIKSDVATHMGMSGDDVVIDEALEWQELSASLIDTVGMSRSGYAIKASTTELTLKYKYTYMSGIVHLIHPITLESIVCKDTGVDLLQRAKERASGAYGINGWQFDGWGKAGENSFFFTFNIFTNPNISCKLRLDNYGVLKESTLSSISIEGGAAVRQSLTSIYDNNGNKMKEVWIVNVYNADGHLTGAAITTGTYITEGAVDRGMECTYTGSQTGELSFTDDYSFVYDADGNIKEVNGVINIFYSSGDEFAHLIDRWSEHWIFNSDGTIRVTYIEDQYNQDGSLRHSDEYTRYRNSDGIWLRVVTAEPLNGPITHVNDATGMVKLPNIIKESDQGDADIVQRKSIEAQIEMKGKEKNYTTSGQMAGTPKNEGSLKK